MICSWEAICLLMSLQPATAEERVDGVNTMVVCNGMLRASQLIGIALCIVVLLQWHPICEARVAAKVLPTQKYGARSAAQVWLFSASTNLCSVHWPICATESHCDGFTLVQMTKPLRFKCCCLTCRGY
jgi:hypothetical protein